MIASIAADLLDEEGKPVKLPSGNSRRRNTQRPVALQASTSTNPFTPLATEEDTDINDEDYSSSNSDSNRTSSRGSDGEQEVIPNAEVSFYESISRST